VFGCQNLFQIWRHFSNNGFADQLSVVYRVKKREQGQVTVLLASNFGHVTLERFDDGFSVLGCTVPQSLKFD
jgi:hypothetical protein